MLLQVLYLSKLKSNATFCFRINNCSASRHDASEQRMKNLVKYVMVRTWKHRRTKMPLNQCHKCKAKIFGIVINTQKIISAATILSYFAQTTRTNLSHITILKRQ